VVDILQTPVHVNDQFPAGVAQVAALLLAVSVHILILQIQQNYSMLQALNDLIRAFVNPGLTNLEEIKVMEERFSARLATASNLEHTRTQAPTRCAN
jgi:hypothetical protein